MKKNLKICIPLLFLAALAIVLVWPQTTKAWCVNCANWNYSPPTTNSYVRISANPSYVTSGGFTTLSWTSQGVYSCTKTGAWSGNAPLGGSETVSVNQNSIYEITCSKNSGGNVYDSVQVFINYPYSYNSTAYIAPQSNGTNSNTNYNTTTYYSSSGQTTLNTSNSGAYIPNLSLNVKSRDTFSSSSFTKETSSQPGHFLDFKIEINNNSTSKVGYMFITLPARLSYINDSAYLDGVKLSQNIITSGIDLSSLGVPSSHALTFQATAASGSAFSENTTVLTINASVKSLDNSAYIASDYTNVLIYKNGVGSEGVVLGASTVNTGTGNTLLISLLVGIIATVLYALLKFYKSSRKSFGKFDNNLSDLEHENLTDSPAIKKMGIIMSTIRVIQDFTKKTAIKTLEIYDL